jgi:hypothetical protein
MWKIATFLTKILLLPTVYSSIFIVFLTSHSKLW